MKDQCSNSINKFNDKNQVFWDVFLKIKSVKLLKEKTKLSYRDILEAAKGNVSRKAERRLIELSFYLEKSSKLEEEVCQQLQEIECRLFSSFDDIPFSNYEDRRGI